VTRHVAARTTRRARLLHVWPRHFRARATQRGVSTIRECPDLVQTPGDSCGLGFPPVDYVATANSAEFLKT